MKSVIKYTALSIIIGISAFIMAISGTFLYFSPQLPEVNDLNNIKLQIPLRVYTQDGQLMGEFGNKRRSPVKKSEIPEHFTQAFLAAEDDRFYQHSGISYKGLARAVVQMLTRSSTQTGGSTITMQVAKNYFLSPEKTIIRKLKEIFLSLQIEDQLSKDQILELYLNKIFLGNRAYGIGAAAQVYYDKPIQELSLAQMAMIAGLPKAPSDYNPIVNPSRSLERRDWILSRMLKLSYITQAEHETAIAEPISAKKHDVNIAVDAPFAAEMARRFAYKKFGENAYTDGYSITTTLIGAFQQKANQAVFNGIMNYDLRHGLKEKEGKLENVTPESLKEYFKRAKTYQNLLPAVVIKSNKSSLDIALASDEKVTINFDKEFNGLKLYSDENSRSTPKSINDIAKVGDIIRVLKTTDGSYVLRQLPEAQAAMISISPTNGGILAMVGGFDFRLSKFDRSTQAARQVGSLIKPFVYAAAINEGMTPATIINDAPVVFDDAQLESTWRPDNSDNTFLGPTRLRKALYLSRNLVSIRILRQTGIEKTRDFISQFGLGKYQLPKDLSLSLGSSAFSPLDMAQAYASFANGGYAIKPFLIDTVTDYEDEILYQAEPAVACENDCPEIQIEQEAAKDNAENSPEVKEVKKAKRIISKQVAFLMDSILQDVTRRGTAYKARQALKRSDIAGKTGTTNGPTDVWFAGYNPDIVTTAWLGFDNNKPLGRGEFGGKTTLPIWIEYMQTALADYEEKSRTPPDGIVSILINPETGKQATPGVSNAIFEYIQEDQLESVKAEVTGTVEDVPVDLENLFE